MKISTVTQTILTAEEGFFLTDGVTYGKTVVLPAGENAAVWREISAEAYDAIVKEQGEEV